MMKSMIPIVMAGIGAIYGLVVSVMISNNLGEPTYTLFKGYMDFASGIAVGVSSLTAGWATGVTGDDGVRGTGLQSKFFTGMILILVFAGVSGLYGLIVALTMNTQAGGVCHPQPYNPCCPPAHAAFYYKAPNATTGIIPGTPQWGCAPIDCCYNGRNCPS